MGVLFDEMLENLQAERAEVERQIRGLNSLQQRHSHLLAAISAMEKLARAYGVSAKPSEADTAAPSEADIDAIKPGPSDIADIAGARGPDPVAQEAMRTHRNLEAATRPTLAVQEAMRTTMAMQRALEGPRQVMQQIQNGARAFAGLVDVRIRQHPRNLPEAAEQVLAETGHPLHIKELVPGVQAKGLSTDKSFEQVRTSLVPSLNRKAAKGETFWKDPDGPIYGLIAWAKQKDEQEAML